MYPSKAVIMVLAFTTIQAEQDGVYFKIEENTFVPHETAVWSGKAASLLSCSLMCARQEMCKSAAKLVCLIKKQDQGTSTCCFHKKDLFISKR